MWEEWINWWNTWMNWQWICLYGFCASLLGWLVGCIEDLRRFSGISAIPRLGSRRYPISEFQVARRGIEPWTSCSESQELYHSTTAAPVHLWNPIYVWKIKLIVTCLYSKWSKDRFVVIQHFWCRKIREIVCRVPREWVKSNFLWQDDDSCRQMYSCWILCLRGLWQHSHGDGKVLWQHKGNWKWTRVWCWQSALVVEFYVLERRRSTWSTPKECQLRRFLSLPTVWHTLHMHPW